MKAVIVEKPGTLAIRDIARPRLTPYTALVRMNVAAICNSTDTKIMEGRFPAFDTYPCTLGHEGVGTVVEAGEKVVSFKVGDRVLNPCVMQTGVAGLASGWGTMAEFALAGDHAAMTADGVCDAQHGYDGVFQTQKALPADVPARQAILMSTWREVWSSFADFSFQTGRALLVIGGGPVGLSFVRLAKIYGLRPVCLSTRSEWKLNKAKALGADAVFPAGADLVERVKRSHPEGFDYVVDAVGASSVMNQALLLVRFDGVLGVYGTVPDDSLTLRKKGAPYNWRLIMHQWPDYAKEAAAHDPLGRFIREGKVSAEDFITHEYALDDVSQGFDAVKQNRALKVLLHVHE